MKAFVFFVFCFFIGISNSRATHIIGGDLTYECITANSYSITMTMYRDCNDSYPFQSNSVKAYNLVTNALVESTPVVTYDEVIALDFIGTDPCINYPDDICVERATYTFSMTLPASLDGYLLVGTACCLASSVQNVVSPLGIVINVNAIIPPLGGGNPSCFDSPIFNEPPPKTFCLNDPLNFDLGAHLPNSDPTISLVHELYTPENGNPPPFTNISFLSPYTYDQPIGTVSGLNLDANTGLLTGIVNETGYFYIGVRVYAIKNGDTIASICRPFRYAVSDCNINTAIIDLEDPLECGNLTVNFDNLSLGADEFLWDFGDIGSGANNTSTVSNASHVFSEFGNYDIQLISTSGGVLECADTAYFNIDIDSVPLSTISVNNSYQCLAANNFDFSALSLQPGVSYLWEFGPNASIASSTLKNPNGIIFNQVGVYNVKLTTIYNECSSEENISIEVFEGLLAEITGPTEGCAPFKAEFTPSVINPKFTYVWRSQGQEITETKGVFNYFNPGVYSVELYVFDEEGCESTDYAPQYISIYEVPETGFTVSKYKLSAGENIIVENTVEKDFKIEFSMETPSKNVNIETNENFTLTMIDTGEFTIVQTVTNNDICISKEEKIINVGPPRVDPPNVYTPNLDGVNDFFYFETYNNRNVEFTVFDRWGLEVYNSDQYELCNQKSGDNCWNGYDDSGKKCVPGVYFYVVSLSNGFRQNGTVSLF